MAPSEMPSKEGEAKPRLGLRDTSASEGVRGVDTTSCSSPSWKAGNPASWFQKPPPPVRWVVEGLIPAGVPGVLAGRSGVGKSSLALLLGLNLAAGRDVLGLSVGKGVPRGVLYVSMEDDKSELWRRCWRTKPLLEESGPFSDEEEELLYARFRPLFPDYRGLPTPESTRRRPHEKGASFDLASQWPVLVEEANRIPGGCGLIVLDTLSRLSDGDENSARDARPFLEASAALAQATGAAVMAVHHVGKGRDSTSGLSLEQRLSPEVLRGSSAYEAGARFVLVMAALNPGEVQRTGLKGQQTPAGDLVALRLSKASFSSKGQSMLLYRRGPEAPGEGCLTLHPESHGAIEALFSTAGVVRIKVPDAVLLALAEAEDAGETNFAAAQKRLWPTSKNQRSQWDKQLHGLRRKGLVTDGRLTPAGWDRAASLGFQSKIEESAN